MTITNPYYRTCRQFSDGSYANSGKEKYIERQEFAQDATQLVPAVAYKRPHQTHATSTLDTICSVIRFFAEFSWSKMSPSVLTSWPAHDTLHVCVGAKRNAPPFGQSRNATF